MAVGAALAPASVPTHLNRNPLSPHPPTHTWGSPHPASGLLAVVGVGRKVVMVENFLFFLLTALLEHQGPCHPGICCRRKEAEQGDGNNRGAGSGSSSPPYPWAAPEISTRYLGEPSSVSRRIPLQSWPVIWGSALPWVPGVSLSSWGGSLAGSYWKLIMGPLPLPSLPD